jgi:hypothetical protein
VYPPNIWQKPHGPSLRIFKPCASMNFIIDVDTKWINFQFIMVYYFIVSNSYYIIFLIFRTPATIQSARAKGGGQEGETYYPQWRRISKSIDRYHFLLVSKHSLKPPYFLSERNPSIKKRCWKDIKLYHLKFSIFVNY